MGDMNFYCPLCCKKGFNSKKSLIEHLSSILYVRCSICDTKYSSIERLVEHLNSDNCESINTTIEFSDETELQNDETNDSMENAENVLATSEDKNYMVGNITGATIKFPSESNVEVNKMYMDFLSKQISKPCLQTQELKLVLEDGESRYVVLTNNDSVENLCTDNAVVTKQNNDGTISLTTVKGAKTGQDSSLNAPQDFMPKTETEESTLEIYSCNTCGVSFSSVIDHIQNFHNDQDVVVEEPLDETPCDNTVTIKADSAEKTDNSMGRGSITNDRLPLRRMITETGDIVETPVVLKDTSEQSSEQPYDLGLVDSARIEVPSKSVSVDKLGQMAKAKSDQKAKISNGTIKNANDEEKSGLYHKVVLQELVTTSGNKIKIYNCISCNLFVPTLAEFKTRPCMISNKYTCPHCPVSYENHKSLCAHMKIHKSKEIVFDSLIKLDFECAVCGTVFPTRKSLKLHKRMHDPVKSRPIEPPVQTNDGQVVNDDKYLCGICHKLIPIDYRAIHQNSHNTNKMNCHICNKKFNSKEFLDMHMSVHSQDKVVVGKQDKSLPYICTYCNRQFARPHEKVKHERIHTGEKPHSCEICGKSFRVSYCLTLHMRTHTGARPYTCPHCGKRFKAHSVYNHHLLTHSEVRAYKCPYCPKAFKTSVQLAGHKNSHTKPFSCQQCNRPFASLYAVRVHMDSHQKQNSLKFSCSLCGASYARAFALKDHVRQVHQADVEAAGALSGLKEEDWMVGDEEKESSQPLRRDINQEITELELNANELIVP